MEKRDADRRAYLDEQHRIKNMESEQKRLEKETKIADARAREE